MDGFNGCSFVLLKKKGYCDPQDIKVLDWCPVGLVLPHGDKVPL